MSENATSSTPPSPTELLGLKLKPRVGRPKADPKKPKAEKKSLSSNVIGLTEVVGVELSYAPSDFVVNKDGRAVVTLTAKQGLKLYHDLAEHLQEHLKHG